jgi:hypothetical protein
MTNNRVALTLGKYEVGFVKCGFWHWRIAVFKTPRYFEFDWGYWLFFVGEV